MHDLWWLRWHWGSAYDIDLRDGLWLARRRDGKCGLLAAEDAEALMGVLGADYCDPE